MALTHATPSMIHSALPTLLPRLVTARVARRVQVRIALHECWHARRNCRRVLIDNARHYQTLAHRCPPDSNLRWTLDICGQGSCERAAHISSAARRTVPRPWPGPGEWLARGLCRCGPLHLAWSWLQWRERRVLRRVLRTFDRLHRLAGHNAPTSAFLLR